jgi:hypothetical protein
MSFNNLPTTQRDLTGEEIVANYLRSKGCHLHNPATGSRPVYRFMIDKDGCAFVFDIKIYPRQFSRPYTRIDLPDYHTYLKIGSVPVLLFFIDAFECCLYLYELNRKDDDRAPIIDNGKVYFHLDEMTVCRSLTVGEVERLGEIKQPKRYTQTDRHFSSLKIR